MAGRAASFGADGVLLQNEGRWALAIDAEAIEVPLTIQRMPPDERRLVELASVVGPEFPLGAVAAIAADPARGGLEVVLERLRRRELIEPTGTY